MARSSSATNRLAAIGLRSAYHARASRASSRASDRISTGSWAIGIVPKDLPPSFFPRNECRPARIDLFHPAGDFVRPRLLCVRIGRSLETVIQGLDNGQTLIQRKLQCLLDNSLFRAHDVIIPQFTSPPAASLRRRWPPRLWLFRFSGRPAGGCSPGRGCASRNPGDTPLPGRSP